MRKKGSLSWEKKVLKALGGFEKHSCEIEHVPVHRAASTVLFEDHRMGWIGKEL